MSMYIVDGSLLTAIGDEIRNKGDLRKIVQLPLVKKSSNCLGPNIPAETPDSAVDEFAETFVINGAISVRVTAYCRLPYNEGRLIIAGTEYCNYNSDPTAVRTITQTVLGESVTIEWSVGSYGWSDAQKEKNRFYYIEVEGLDANGNAMETYNKPLSNGSDGLTLAQMAEALTATTRMPLADDVAKILTTNGTHDMNGYRWAEVQVANEKFPTTYKEVVVTSEDNIHFDLSDYIVSDNQYFSICFTYETSVNGTGDTYGYQTGYYHHNPMMRDLTNQVFNRMNVESPMTINKGALPHGGVATWKEFEASGVTAWPKVASFENGILSFIQPTNSNRTLTVGTSAVLRYVE